jgi:hypothetical protein
MTLAELVQAYHDGTLKAPLMLDNDHTSVWPDEGAQYNERYVFEMHPEELLEQALTLLGIPWEHV